MFINIPVLALIVQNCVAQRLLQSHAIFRHADRAPTTGFSSPQSANFFFRGLGQLSDQGLAHSDKLGKMIRNRTVAVGLLDPRMIPAEISFRSTNSPRCLMTSSAVGAAMFERLPPNETKPAYVPVLTVPQDMDFICSAHTSPSMYAYISQIAGMNYTATSYYEVVKFYRDKLTNQSAYFQDTQRNSILEPLAVEKPVGLPVPTWYNSSADDEANNILYQCQAIYAGVREYHSDWLIKCRIGLLLNKIANDIQLALNSSAMNSTDGYTKFNGYTTPDVMLMPLVESLGIYESALGSKITPFASCLLIELWMVADEPKVKIFYYNGNQNEDFKDYTNVTFGCQNQAFCSLTSFLNATSIYRLTDSELNSQCGYDISTNSSQSVLMNLVEFYYYLISSVRTFLDVEREYYRSK